MPLTLSSGDSDVKGDSDGPVRQGEQQGKAMRGG
jgi:hypothetical protein